jgi:hypothetical protein
VARGRIRQDPASSRYARIAWENENHSPGLLVCLESDYFHRHISVLQVATRNRARIEEWVAVNERVSSDPMSRKVSFPMQLGQNLTGNVNPDIVVCSIKVKSFAGTESSSFSNHPTCLLSLNSPLKSIS